MLVWTYRYCGYPTEWLHFFLLPIDGTRPPNHPPGANPRTRVAAYRHEITRITECALHVARCLYFISMGWLKGYYLFINNRQFTRCPCMALTTQMALKGGYLRVIIIGRYFCCDFGHICFISLSFVLANGRGSTLLMGKKNYVFWAGMHGRGIAIVMQWTTLCQAPDHEMSTCGNYH